MSKTTWKKYPATFMWAKVFESNRDMGPGDDSDVGKKITESQGQYTVDAIVDDATKAQMIADGIPETALGYPQFKQVEGIDGWVFRAKRPHVNVRFKEDDGSPKVMGPPVVIDYNESEESGELVELKRRIGNGSKGLLKLAIYKGRGTIITLDGIAIQEMVEYEDDGVKF